MQGTVQFTFSQNGNSFSFILINHVDTTSIFISLHNIDTRYVILFGIYSRIMGVNVCVCVYVCRYVDTIMRKHGNFTTRLNALCHC